MILGIHKYNKEIGLLKKASFDGSEVVLNPMRKEQLKQAILEKIGETNNSFLSVIRNFRKNQLAKYFVSSLLGFALVSGTTLAAKQSLPGDSFYPVKVATEKLLMNLTFSSKAKAELADKQARVRLEEYAKLHTSTPVSKRAVSPATTRTVPKELKAAEVNTNIQSIPTSEVIVTAPVPVLTEQEIKAKTGFENSIQTLNDIKHRLEDKGDSREVAKVNERINKLKRKATEQGLIKVEAKVPVVIPDIDVEANTTTKAILNLE